MMQFYRGYISYSVPYDFERFCRKLEFTDNEKYIFKSWWETGGMSLEEKAKVLDKSLRRYKVWVVLDDVTSGNLYIAKKRRFDFIWAICEKIYNIIYRNRI